MAYDDGRKGHAGTEGMQGCSIVYFGNDWFAENRTSSHHIARRLAERFPLLYVESPGQRAPGTNARDLKKIASKLQAAVQPPRQLGPRLWHMVMPQIPFRRLPFVAAANRAAGVFLVRRAMRHLEFGPAISWFVAPDAGALAGRLGEDLSVYYCTDNYSAFPGVDADLLSRMDDDLARRADQIFVSSPTLLAHKQSLNPDVAHSPHGVDTDLFAKASETGTPAAPAAAALPKPVIGFFGLIEAWIDLDLVEFLARARPNWTFLMIGRVAVPAPALMGLANVHFPGPQPYESLANWARAFDVAIIPYRQNQQVFNANPLKLREYLATGKPIVAVPTPEIDKFAHCVRIAGEPARFLLEIEAALTEGDDVEKRIIRQQQVRTATWDARVADILATVERRHRAKHGMPPG
ncbi:MAG: glycosyltransferase [Bryobacterales bacterium]|nr:glycosyltransferase [Bryobacterales bacterium]